MTVNVIYCPKCNGQNVSTEMISPIQKRMISMDELVQSSPIQALPLVLQIATWRATCEDCGYSVEYQSN